VINVISFFTSIYAGVAVFAIIGYMATEYQVPVNCVINSGRSLLLLLLLQSVTMRRAIITVLSLASM